MARETFVSDSAIFMPGETARSLLRRAVSNARDHSKPGVPVPRWSAVMAVFGLGSGYAAQLCRNVGLDPDEKVTAPYPEGMESARDFAEGYKAAEAGDLCCIGASAAFVDGFNEGNAHRLIAEVSALEDSNAG